MMEKKAGMEQKNKGKKANQDESDAAHFTTISKRAPDGAVITEAPPPLPSFCLHLFLSRFISIFYSVRMERYKTEQQWLSH